MIPSEEEPIIFAGDHEHVGIRLLSVPLLILGVAIAYFLLRLILAQFSGDASLMTVVSCAGAIPIGLSLAHAGEQIARRGWPSGRQLIVGRSHFVLEDRGTSLVTLDLTRPIDVTRWRFALQGYPRGGRERRIPGGWSCFGCQYRQDTDSIVVFAFASPRESERIAQGSQYHQINPKEVYDTSYVGKTTQPMVRPRLSPDVLAGNDGIYWAAERQRWESGLELTIADFEAAQAVVASRQTGDSAVAP